MIISSILDNWWYFVGGCLIYSLWIILALAYAAHLDAVAEQIAQNDQIIELLSVKPQTASASTPEVSTLTAEEKPVVQKENTQDAKTPVNVSNADESGWIVCPICSLKQRRNRTKCLLCGNVLEK